MSKAVLDPGLKLAIIYSLTDIDGRDPPRYKHTPKRILA